MHLIQSDPQVLKSTLLPSLKQNLMQTNSSFISAISTIAKEKKKIQTGCCKDTEWIIVYTYRKGIWHTDSQMIHVMPCSTANPYCSRFLHSVQNLELLGSTLYIYCTLNFCSPNLPSSFHFVFYRYCRISFHAVIVYIKVWHCIMKSLTIYLIQYASAHVHIKPYTVISFHSMRYCN